MYSLVARIGADIHELYHIRRSEQPQMPELIGVKPEFARRAAHALRSAAV